MNDWAIFFIGLAIGSLLGAAGMTIVLLMKRSALQNDLARAGSQSELLEQTTTEQRADIDRLRGELAEADQHRERAQRDLATLNEKLGAKETALAEQRALLDDAQKKLADAFASLGSKALQANNEQFLALAAKTFETLMKDAKGDSEKRQQAIDGLVKPIRELLEKQNTAVGEIEKKREVAYKGLEEHIKSIAESHEKLNTETHRLVTALRRPEQRGQWGELQLRNVVELAGMTKHCDFEEQVQTDDPNTRDRPDMTVNLPGGGIIVVDSKVALDAYLDALTPDADRDDCLKRHANHVMTHFKSLSSKKYWDQFPEQRTPQLVVMFMPLESALVAALEVKPDLHAEAMRNHVLIATPTLLVALLRAVAYGWRQEDVAANAREISEVGRELYTRLSTLTDHFEKVGKGLTQATTSYNKAVGSLERMVLPSTRKLRAMSVTADKEIEAPNVIELEARDITADELRPAPPSPLPLGEGGSHSESGEGDS